MAQEQGSHGPDRLFGWDALLETEDDVVATTSVMLGGFDEVFREAVDCLLKLPHCWPPSKPVETAVDELRSYSAMHLLQAPYTFRSAYVLYKKGYYLEALILYRHLVEALAQMLYFRQHPEAVKGHWINKQRVGFKTIFNSVAPGYYKAFYSRQLSDMAHGGITKDMVRVDSQNNRVILGSEYSERWATYVVNSLTTLLYGFLRQYPDLMPGSTPPRGDLELKIPYLLSWGERAMIEHVTTHPMSRAWYDAMQGLIGWSPPPTSKRASGGSYGGLGAR